MIGGNIPILGEPMNGYEQLTAVVDEVAPRAIALSHAIHARPELGFEEYFAAATIADLLAESGFEVERGVGELPTALRASFGTGELVVGIVGEYDALPEIGHACGHNVIAGAAVGAALTLATQADELGITVRFFGTPAEENGGGKALMLDRGVFDGTHLAMMVHPSPFDGVECNVLAIGDLTVTYTGHPAHASMAPFEGVNALDALTLAQVAIGLLRQQLPPGDQIHGIISEGGSAPNVIPEKTTARYCYRSLDLERLQALRERVVRCFDAGALATGCTVTYQADSPPYTEFRNDTLLCDLYRTHSVALGRHPQAMGEGGRGLGSTDMANVSRVIPAIHPMIAVEAGGAANHQAGFTAACATPSGDAAVRDGALLMALTVADVARDPGHRATYLAATTAVPTPSPAKAGLP